MTMQLIFYREEEEEEEEEDPGKVPWLRSSERTWTAMRMIPMTVIKKAIGDPPPPPMRIWELTAIRLTANGD